MTRRALSVVIVLAGLFLGLVGMLLFFQRIIGLSFPLFIALAVGTTLLCARAGRTPVNWRNLWPLAPVAFFALMVAVRAQQTVALFNIGAALTLSALALHYLRRAHPLDTAATSEHVGGVALVSVNAAFGAPAELGGALAWLRARSWQGRTLVAVARGLLIGLPVVFVFALLLAAADTVFAGYLDDLWRLLAPHPSDQLLWRGVYALSAAWLAIGALAWGVTESAPARRRYVTVPTAEGAVEAVPLAAADDDEDDDDDEGEGAPVKRKRGGLLRLNIIEAGIVLGLVNLLFAAFVLVQFAYFFGGTAFIEARGLTYAEYARRGFFELVAVAALTLGLALWLNRATARPDVRAHTVFRALCAALAALMAVMLVSAWQRMLLYEEAYGFTHLRVYSQMATLWLGALFGAFLLEVFHVRRNIFALGLLLAATGYLITLNLLNVDLYIAERNINRYHDGRALDLGFLVHLSVDAVPAVVPLHHALAGRPAAQEWTGQWLAHQLRVLDAQRADDALAALITANVARASAWAQLDALRASLPDHDPRFFDTSRAEGYFNIYAATSEPRPPATPPPSGAAE